MYAIDFEYDGYLLSDMGFMVCHFDSQGIETVSNGSNITFNTISMIHGEKWYLTSSQFDECLSTTIQICKKCTDDFRITTHELRALSAWLNRKQFHKFKFHGEDCPNIYFEAKMNVSRIESSGELYGLELEIQTDPMLYMNRNSLSFGLLPQIRKDGSLILLILKDIFILTQKSQLIKLVILLFITILKTGIQLFKIVLLERKSSWTIQ